MAWVWVLFVAGVIVGLAIVLGRARRRQGSPGGRPRREVVVRLAKGLRERVEQGRRIVRDMSERGGRGVMSGRPPPTTPSRPPPVAAPRREAGPPLRPAPATPPELRWVGPGQMLRMRYVTLSHPMVYVTDAEWLDEPSAIVPALPIAAEPNADLAGLGQFHRYADLTNGQRRAYLDWLADGRRAIPPSTAFLVLYFFGLERRAVVDDADHLAIFNEVLRLRRLHNASETAAGAYDRTFDHASAALLWFVAARAPSLLGLDHVRALAESMRGWTDDHLAQMLAWFAARPLLLPAWAAFLVAEKAPQSLRTSVVVKRAPVEFGKLFSRRFEARFSVGMALASAKRERKYTHHPANPSLAPAHHTGPNPAGLSSQFRPLSDLWNECVTELRAYSTAIAAAEGGARPALTPAAWAALPEEIRADVEHPLAETVGRLVESATVAGRAEALVEVGTLAGACGVELGERVGIGQSRELAETLGHMAYAIEPDARLTGQAYKADETVAVFPLTDEYAAAGADAVADADAAAADAERYNVAACMLRAGLYVATAAEGSGDDATKLVAQRIETSFSLSAGEIRRLDALGALLAARGVDPGPLAHLAKRLTPAHRQLMGQLLLALVTADDVVSPKELAAVRKCYRTLGFKKAEVDAALGNLVGPRAEPRQGGATAAAPTEVPAAPKAGLRLDRNAIAAIMRDTQEVARMLADAMRAEEDDAPRPAVAAKPAASAATAVAPPPPPPTPEPAPPAALPASTSTTVDPTLPARYAAFFQALVARGEWPTPDAEALARQHGHMLSGALEALNDWSVEHRGGQLFIEDADRVIVEQAYLS